MGVPDVVDLFVNSSRAGEFSDHAIDAGAKVVCVQLGVVDEGATQRARAAGLTVVMDKCPVIKWPEVHG